MQNPTISSFQTQHFPLEPSQNAQRDVKFVISTVYTIPAIPAPNPWRSAEKAVSSAHLDRMEAIAMPAAFAPSSPEEHRAKLDLEGRMRAGHTLEVVKMFLFLGQGLF